MKIVFLIAILANLIFFLLNYPNYVAVAHHHSHSALSSTTQFSQIQLLSEINTDSLNQSQLTAIISQPFNLQLTSNSLSSLFNTIENNHLKWFSLYPHLYSYTINHQLSINAQNKSAKIVPLTSTNNRLVYCYQLKSFADKKILQRWLIKHSISIIRAKQYPAIIEDYMVYQPAINRLQAKIQLAQLKQQLFTQAFIYHDKKSYGISLGIFKRQAGAIQTQRQLQLKDISTVIKPRGITEAKMKVEFNSYYSFSQLRQSLNHLPSEKPSLLHACQSKRYLLSDF